MPDNSTYSDHYDYRDTCPNHFKCAESGDEDKIKSFTGKDIIICNMPHPQTCEYAFAYGKLYLCECPIRHN